MSPSAAHERSLRSLPRQTLVVAAYLAVRAAIVDGRFPPGQKLVVRVLAEELRRSQTPLKAALAALEREGFVIAIPDRGYFVPRTDGEDLRQIYELREVVDGIAARNAAQSDSRLELVGILRNLLAQQHRCVELGDLRRYSDLDVLFHSAIWQACGNPRLIQIAENLLGQLRIGSATTASHSHGVLLVSGFRAGSWSCPMPLGKPHRRASSDSWSGSPPSTSTRTPSAR